MVQEVKRAYCEMCHNRCRVSVYSEKGRLLKVEEDRSNPSVESIFPPTRSCLRLRAIAEIMYHPNRVNFPLKRVGERGEGKWQRISWQQAFDEVAQRIGEVKEKYGPEAVVLTNGTGRTTFQFMARFMCALGSPNIIGASQICFGPSLMASAAMFGWPFSPPVPMPGEKAYGSEGSKCLLVQGTEASQSNWRLWKSIRDARELGMKIINIDPRKTQSVAYSDLWLQLRPGTDTALLMAMLNFVIKEGLYDKDFVERWCSGFDKVAERVRDFSPEKAAKITSVPAEKIREAAVMYATNKPALSTYGMGVEQLQDAIKCLQTKYILPAITSNVDVEGGHYLTGPARFIRETEMELHEILSPEQRAKQLGADRFKLGAWPGYQLINQNSMRVWGVKEYCGIATQATAHPPTAYRAMITGKPYPVRVAISVASNPMVTPANTHLVYKALKSLDLYVVIDFWKTPSAELADYLLPAAMWIERPYLSSKFGSGNTIVAGEQALPSAIPGEYDHKTDYEILRGIGMRLGQKEHWPWETLEETYDYQLKPLGVTHKEFMAAGGFDYPPPEYKKYEKTGFATPTGKVELYSTIFEKLGYDPLPCFEEPVETPVSAPKLAEEYPLILITGARFLPMYHSEHRQIGSLRKRHPYPMIQINPETAKKLNIKNGDWAWIESPRGRVRMKCEYFTGIDPTVVSCEHGWWFPELPAEEPWLHGVWESNINVLTSDDLNRCDKLSGGWPLRTLLCKVYV